MNWDLISWSFKVVRRNPHLILFPIFSALGAMIGLLLWSTWGQSSIQKLLQSQHWDFQDYLWLAPAYLIASFAVVFFNCALAACANAYFAGEEPTLGYGMRHAMARLRPILAWTLLSTSVGLILNALERRASWAGKVAVWLFGAAWGMATYLVVPILIAEDRGALATVRRSTQLVRDTWSAQIVGDLRFGWRALILFIPCLVLGVLGMNGYPLFIPVTVAYGVLAISLLSAAKGVFEVALYRYAALGETPANWQEELLPGIFGTEAN